MSRSHRARGGLALVLLLAAGCQDYNFNPVGQCVIQPGTEGVTLSSVSTADVLFVVDDSGSMAGKQAKLAASFTTFIGNLDKANADRVAAGLQPFDFHIAVTSTSVFWNGQTTQTCRSDCTGAAGQLVCCDGAVPVKQPKACATSTDCTVTGTTCSTTCAGLLGEKYCCGPTGAFPPGSLTEVVPCSRAGTACGTFQRHFDFAGCTASGTAVDHWPYPRGDFLSWTSGAAVNPRVLHFDKELYTGTANRQGFTRQDLVAFFSGGTLSATSGGATVQGNVLTGTCGSGEEQGFNAARLALEKAVAGTQKDTYSMSAGRVATWDPVTRTASSTAEWLHPNAKLVLVFVGDEDDCSAPEDPSGGVVMDGRPPGNDACVHDQDPTNPAPTGHKLYDVVGRFVDYFSSLGRPLGAAFIESLVSSSSQSTCSGDACVPGLCCQTDCTDPGTAGFCVNLTTTPSSPVCGGQAGGTRFMQAAAELRGRGADVVAGSICDTNFGPALGQIAEIVKPPSGLTLPTQPAASEIALLRIADSSGKTRKLCGKPLAPGTYASLAATQATLADWWFTAGPDATSPAGAWNPVSVSRFVYINPQGQCIANPGETYSADYLGQLPAGGCGDDAGPGSGDAMCARVLGGSAGSWTCFAGMSGSTCTAPTWNATTKQGSGTCLCGPRSKNCPNG